LAFGKRRQKPRPAAAVKTCRTKQVMRKEAYAGPGGDEPKSGGAGVTI
jgi:hypothetical protein